MTDTRPLTNAPTDRLHALEEADCLLCSPAGHENCEKYTTVGVLDPETVPVGEDDTDHVFIIPVCLAHYETLQQYRKGRNVSEVDI